MIRIRGLSSKWYISIIICFTCLFFLCSCSAVSTPDEATIPDAEGEVSANEKKEEVRAVKKMTLSEGNLSDEKPLYENIDDSVITMYLTVNKGNKADGSDHTWQEINKYSVYDYEDMGVDRYKVEGLLQIDETGNGIDSTSFGYGETVPNVSVQVRGQTSSLWVQKNYKIRIKDERGEYRGQRTLNLNKHANEPYRFINKLCYDLLDTVPQLVGARTRFVHLYVKDETKDGSSDFTDYGLYTMVEQINRKYLKNRELDENGQLYKVTFFEWNKPDEIMVPKNDPRFDQAKFNKYLEIKGNPDPSKLQATINDLHDFSKPIEKIIDEHFDDENICYWMAFNILSGNVDVGSRNLFIYSPLNSGKFYLLCWDMDDSFKKHYTEIHNLHDGDSWEQGMTKFLGLTLVNRMMKEQKYRDMLTAAVDDLYHNYMTADIVNARAKEYAEIIKPFIYSDPDLEYAEFQDASDYDELVSRLGEEVDYNYERFKESMKRPWPFYVELPIIDRDKDEMLLNWGVSYDYNGESVTYDYQISTDYLFENIVDEGHELSIPVVSTRVLEPGIYYLKITATNESGYTTDCFDYHWVDRYGKCYGCYCFTVNNDGTTSAFEPEPQ